MSANITILTDDTFDDFVRSSDKPVIVDMWAPWCSPCVKLGKIFEGLAEAYGEDVNFCKFNTNDNPKKATEMNVLSLPVVSRFDDGVETARLQGTVTVSKLTDMVTR